MIGRLFIRLRVARPEAPDELGVPFVVRLRIER